MAPERVNYITHDVIHFMGHMLWSGGHTLYIPVVLWAVCSTLFTHFPVWFVYISSYLILIYIVCNQLKIKLF